MHDGDVDLIYCGSHGLMAYGDAEPARVTCDRAARLGDREYYAAKSKRGAGLDPFWDRSLLAHFMPGESDAGFDPTRMDDWAGPQGLSFPPEGQKEPPDFK